MLSTNHTKNYKNNNNNPKNGSECSEFSNIHRRITILHMPNVFCSH